MIYLNTIDCNVQINCINPISPSESESEGNSVSDSDSYSDPNEIVTRKNSMDEHRDQEDICEICQSFCNDDCDRMLAHLGICSICHRQIDSSNHVCERPEQFTVDELRLILFWSNND